MEKILYNNKVIGWGLNYSHFWVC